MDKRNYYNMAIIMKQCFLYAKDAEYIDVDTWEKVKINTKRLIGYSFGQFNKNLRNITALAIPIIFVTGLRIGELVCLKYSDLVR